MKKISCFITSTLIMFCMGTGSVYAKSNAINCSTEIYAGKAIKMPVTSLAVQENEVIKLVNKERARYGLPALKANVQLSNIARIKSRDMLTKNYFSHMSPTFGSTFSLLTRYGISYSAAGENIAYGYNNAASVVRGWMNSPGHRANILGKQYRQIGVGAAKSSSGKIYWTQVFIKK